MLTDKRGRTAGTMGEKAAILRGKFFPRPPDASLGDIDSAEYLEPIDFPPIQEDEVSEAIRQAPADKAPGEDGTPNTIWHILAPVVCRPYDTCLMHVSG
jgi:hypothetical protein